MVTTKKPKVIVVLGSPGSGKGAQAGLLANRLGFFLLETSSVVGAAISRAGKGEHVVIEGKKYFFKEQAEIRRKGLIWDGRFTAHFMAKKLEELAREEKSVILSGSPRNLEDAKRTIPLLRKLYGLKNVVMVFLEITPQETIRRNKHRRECELARHSILYSKETSGLTRCPLDGSRLVYREDDNPEIIKERLKEYREKTLPVLRVFRKERIAVKHINGEKSVSDVFENILKVLKTK